MDNSRYLDGARMLLRLIAEKMPEFDGQEVASLCAVAVGMRVGEETFPRDPRTALMQMGLVLGITAQYVQRAKINEAVSSCVGSA